MFTLRPEGHCKVSPGAGCKPPAAHIIATEPAAYVIVPSTYRKFTVYTIIWLPATVPCEPHVALTDIPHFEQSDMAVIGRYLNALKHKNNRRRVPFKVP